MPSFISKDGSSIAYSTTGRGPGLILVNGALSHRNLYGDQALADSLASAYTVFYFDRRGRGESGDVQPYFVQKEIDDLELLIEKAGGIAYVYGSSSGAALSLLAAEKLGPKRIKKLALYEPPYTSAKAKDNQQYDDVKNLVSDLVAAGRFSEAVQVFLSTAGMPDTEINELQKSPEWHELERVGTTLMYDFDILGNGIIPVEIAKRINIRTHIIDGEKSLAFMNTAMNELAECIPGATRQTLKGQTHQASPRVVADALATYFVD